MKVTNSSLSSLVVCLALLLSTVDAAALEPRAKKCTQSTQCNVAKKHFCNRGYCAKAVADGQACYKNQGCLNGLCFNGQCGSLSSRPLGAVCSASTQCQSGYCGWSTCRAPAAKGQYCYKDVGCASKKCNKEKNKCAAVTQTVPTSSTSTIAGTSTLGQTTAVATTSASAPMTTQAASTTAASTASTSTQTTAAATTLTATASTASTTSATASNLPVITFPAVDAAPVPTAALARNGDFSDGQLAPFTASSTGTGSSASVQQINGNYVAVINVGPGGSVSLKQTLSSSSLTKRDGPKRWMLSAAAAISSFTKASDSAAYAACKAIATIGAAGESQSTVNLYNFVYEYAQEGAYIGWSEFSTKWATGPTEATVTYTCDPGMSAQFLTDNYSIGPYLHTYPSYSVEDGSFESGTLASEWSMAASTEGVTYAIKDDEANAHTGSHYLEGTVDGTWWDWTYQYESNAFYVDLEDPDWQPYTFTFWYNVVSLEDTTGGTSIRDGCGFQSGGSGYQQWFEQTDASKDFMQVNDPALTLPTGWKKAVAKFPLGDTSIGSALWCRDGVKATIRIDDVSIQVPTNETAV